MPQVLVRMPYFNARHDQRCLRHGNAPHRGSRRCAHQHDGADRAGSPHRGGRGHCDRGSRPGPRGRVCTPPRHPGRARVVRRPARGPRGRCGVPPTSGRAARLVDAARDRRAEACALREAVHRERRRGASGRGGGRQVGARRDGGPPHVLAPVHDPDARGRPFGACSERSEPRRPGFTRRYLRAGTSDGTCSSAAARSWTSAATPCG